MERVTVTAPVMFADHHVLKVREVLLGLEGVEDVYASSAWHTVLVSYDESKTKPAAIEEAMAEAGYAPGKATPILAQNLEQFKDPAWEALGVRVTQTNRLDLEMSGDHRKY